MTFVVVVADDIDEVGLQPLKEADGYEVVSTHKQPERLPEELKRADALLVRSSTRVTEELLRGAPRLKMIGRAGIGVDNIDVDAATRRGIAVLNAPGANTVSAAEHTFALLFALVRRVPWAAESMRHGDWDRKKFGGTELRGKTLGLVGLGRIGMHVAGVARALGMEVMAYDPYLPKARAKEIGVKLASLNDVLAASDVISLHAPQSEATRHLINAETLAKMKPTAVIINAARGALIDDQALFDAVESGKIAGAALDVFDPEPLPADSILRSSDRLILTPHLAASTQEAQARVAVEICRSVRLALETGDIGGAVNVPGVSSDVLARARGSMDLAVRMGRMAGYLAGGPVDSVDVYFGGDDDGSAKPVSLGAVQGVLESMGVGPVSLVNTSQLAEERNIVFSRRIGRPVKGFHTTVGIKLECNGRAVSVMGTPDPGRAGRIIQIDDYAVDIPAEGFVLILRNRDVPGVIGHVGTVLGAADVNIAFYHQSRSLRNKEEALAAIAVDHAPDPKVLEELGALEEVVDIYLAKLG